MDNRVKYGVKGAFFVYTEIFLSRAVAFAIPILLIRNLTKEEYGIYVLVPSLLLIVAYTTNFGLEDVIFRYVPEYLKNRAPRRVNALFFTTAFIRVATLAITLSILFLFKGDITELLNAPPLFEEIFLAVLVFLGLSRLNFLIGDNFTNAYKQRHYVSVIRVVTELVKLLFFVFVIWRGDGIYGILVAMCGYRLVELVIYVALDAKKVFDNFQEGDTSQPLRSEFRRIAKFASLSFLGRGFLSFRNLAIDNLIIAYFMSPVAVASYGLAAFFPNLLRAFAPSRMLGAVLLPLMIEEYVKDKNTPFLAKIHRFTQKMNMFLLFPLAAGALVLAEKIITYIFTPDYLDALSVVYVLVIPLLFTTLADAFFLLCEVLERKEIVLKSSLFALYNLVADILLIPEYGIMGAAIATASASVFLYIYVWGVFRYSLRMDLKFPFGAAARIIINTVVMAVIILAMLRWIESAFMVIVAVVLGVTVYAVCSYFNRAFSPEERRSINESVGRNWFPF